MFGDWGAGFAAGVSGGYLTDVYEHYSGKKVEPKHGMLFNAGTITGVGVSFLIGMKLPTLAATAVGPLRWVAVAGTAVDTAFDVYGAAQATQNLHQSYQEDGKWEAKDAWNLLSYVPFVGMFLGVKKGIGAARKAQGGVEGVDDVLKTKKTKTHVEGGGPLRCSSFIAGTEILTAEGEKNIEDIEIGDWVIADDPTTPGEIEKRQVLSTFSREADEIFDLYVDGEIISTTAEHAFWTRDEGWVDAEDLEVGDWLQTDEETFVDVDRIERREGKTTVYNFEVEGFPTYFVSDLGILVHNAGCKLKPDPQAQGSHTVFKFDNETGEIRSYETFVPTTNPRDPKPWQSLFRFDKTGKPHYNKVTKQHIPTPHINDPNIPGGVRPARPDEIPGR